MLKKGKIRKPSRMMLRSKMLWIANILLLLSFAAMLSAMAIMFTSTNSITRQYTPLTHAVHQIELQTNRAHLWLERAVMGDSTVRIEDVLAHIDKSEQILRTILEGNLSTQDTMDALEATSFQDNIASIQTVLAEFRHATERRWQTINRPDSGSEAGQHYNTVFKQLLGQTQEIHDSLQQQTETDARRFQTVSIWLLGISCAVLVATAISMNYLMIYHHKSEHKLIAFNQQLQANEQQLRAANQQLCATDQQLRAANQQLRASESQLKLFNKQLLIANQKLTDAEQQLLENRRILNNTGKLANIGGWEHDLETGTATWTEALYDIIEIPYDHPIPGPNEHLDFYPEEDRRLLDKLYQHAIEKQIPFDHEFQAFTAKQKPIWVRIYAQPILQNGRCVKMRGIFQDITERKKNEQELQDSRTRLNTIFQSVPIGICRLKNRVFQQVNPAFCELFGYTQDEFIGLKTRLLYDTEEQFNQWGKLLYSDLKRYGQAELEVPLKHKDGHIIHTICRGVLVNPDDPEEGQLFGFYDMTERRQAELALQESEQRYRLLFENIMNGFALHELVLDDSGKPVDYIFLDVNNAFEHITTLKRDAIIGKPVSQVLPGTLSDPADWVGRYANVALTGKEIRFEQFSEVLGKWFSVLAFSFKRGQFATIFEDVTERKKAEQDREALMQRLESRNEELQSIVYISSHDLKTPLININGFGKMLEKHCDKLGKILQNESADNKINTDAQKLLSEDIPEDIEFITQSAAKMNALINGLLEVSRAGTASLTPTRLNMNQLVRNIIKNAAFRIQEKKAEITVDDLAPCIADASQISRVFMNLIDNALKYTHPSRTPTIHISCTAEDEKCIYCVEDNGIGIRPEYHDKIFEVFHRLDPKSQIDGEGLGLAIVQRIINLHNGKIWVESDPEQGSKFFISLSNKEPT